VTKIAIGDHYEIHPAVKIPLLVLTVILSLAALVTAGSSLGTKLGFLSSTLCMISLCLCVVPSLKVWRRVE